MLEGRANVRAQLGSLEDALADGNRMLSVEKTNPKVRVLIILAYGRDISVLGDCWR